ISEYAMISFMNEKLDAHSLTFLVGTGNRFYLYHVPVISGGHYSIGPLIRAIKNSKDAPELATTLRSQGITHLMAHAPRMIEMLQSVLSDPEKQVWNAFQHDFLERQHIVGMYYLWKIKA